MLISLWSSFVIPYKHCTITLRQTLLLIIIYYCVIFKNDFDKHMQVM